MKLQQLNEAAYTKTNYPKGSAGWVLDNFFQPTEDDYVTFTRYIPLPNFTVKYNGIKVTNARVKKQTNQIWFPQVQGAPDDPYKEVPNLEVYETRRIV